MSNRGHLPPDSPQRCSSQDALYLLCFYLGRFIQPGCRITHLPSGCHRIGALVCTASSLSIQDVFFTGLPGIGQVVHRFFLHRLQLSRPYSRFSIRSVLTDAPVASFTTSRFIGTQHATGLMVKVAPLLPTRDLLSSQRQLRWTHTLVLLQVGLDVETSAICIAVLWFRQTSFDLAFCC
jgi:hypothetical protein